jgi:hypothetical protein
VPSEGESLPQTWQIAQYRLDLRSRQDRHHRRQRLQNFTGHTLGVFKLGLGHLLLGVPYGPSLWVGLSPPSASLQVGFVSDFHSIRRGQPGAVHERRYSANTGSMVLLRFRCIGLFHLAAALFIFIAVDYFHIGLSMQLFRPEFSRYFKLPLCV